MSATDVRTAPPAPPSNRGGRRRWWAALASVPWLAAIVLAASLAWTGPGEEPSAASETTGLERREGRLATRNAALAAAITKMEDEIRALRARGNELRRDLSRNELRIESLLSDIAARRAAIAEQQEEAEAFEGEPIDPGGGDPSTPPEDQCTTNPDGTTDCPSA